MIRGKQETILPMIHATTLIDGDENASNSVQELFKPVVFPLVNRIVIVSEFNTNP